jgi:membrane protein YdbS with pleckstrin-like domain
MPFPRRLLSEGEELVLDLRPHWIALVKPAIETAVILAAMIVALAHLRSSWPGWVSLAVVGVAVLLFLGAPAPRLVRWVTSHFVVTSARVIHRSGLIAKRSTEIPLGKISDVKFHQGVIERLIGAGDLTLESPGEYGQEYFSHVPNPEQVQKTIYELTESNRRQPWVVTPGSRSTGSDGPVRRSSVADELAKLEKLRRAGILTDEEFQAQKTRLLDTGASP